MARRKNTKRIDPRYFLNETVNRDDDGSVSEGCGEMEPEGPMDISQLSPEEAFDVGMAAARDAIDQAMGGGGPPPEEAMHEEITHDPRSPMEALEAKAWAEAFPKAWAELKKMGDGILDLVRAAGLQVPEPEPVDDDQEMEL